MFSPQNLTPCEKIPKFYEYFGQTIPIFYWDCDSDVYVATDEDGSVFEYLSEPPYINPEEDGSWVVGGWSAKRIGTFKDVSGNWKDSLVLVIKK